MNIRYPLACILFILLFFGFHPKHIHFEKTDHIDSLELYNPDISHVETWIAQHDEFSEEEMNRARMILQQDFKIQTGDSTLTKIMKIAKGVVGRMKDLNGKPETEVFELTPCQLYDRCKRGDVSVYCTQYSLLFTFFCKMAGITVRSIESFGANDRHSTYEFFLPEERRWIWSDLINNIIYLEDEIGKLNLLQTVGYLRNKQLLDVNVIGLNDSLKRKVSLGLSAEWALAYNFDSTCVFNYYRETNLSWVYSRKQRWARFLGNKTWFSRYAVTPPDNTGYYLKYVLFLALLVSIIFVIRPLIRMFYGDKDL